ncbi:MAG: acyl-CoA thioesterase [Anaerolineaceae bacterium]|nr:acyl-CoA thioesterase [Anaerolineaceae bacterium]
MMLDAFRHHIPVEVRFGDLDAMGHVNNAKYLTYLETARIRYVHEVCTPHTNWSELGMILAKVVIEYKAPLLYGDMVEVFTRVSRLGNKSFEIEHVITRMADGQTEIAAQGVTTMVAYDYQAQRTMPVSDFWRERILAYEPALSPGSD